MPPYTKIFIVENSYRIGVYKNYMPNYDKRMKMLNIHLKTSTSKKFTFLNINLDDNDMASDGIHFSASGHKKISQKMIEKIK